MSSEVRDGYVLCVYMYIIRNVHVMIVWPQMYTYPTMTSYRTNCYSSIIFCFPLAVVTWLLYGSKGWRMDGVCVCPVCMTRTQPLWLWVNSLILMHAVCNDRDRKKMHTLWHFLLASNSTTGIHHAWSIAIWWQCVGTCTHLHPHPHVHTHTPTNTCAPTHTHTHTHWGKL